VGEYFIGETLGQGQFATVKSCCLEGAEGTELAIKIIKKERFTTFVALKRISIEIEVLRRLKSQYIVSIKDVLQTKNHLYLVTEKGGKDLFESFDDNPDGIPELWARDIIMKVFQGKWVEGWVGD
jgi:serine/threonine protein kinase